MKKTLFLFLIFTASLYTSCKGDKKSEESSNQMDLVMDIHDEVMPKMGKLGKLVGELKARVDSTEEGMAYEHAMNELQDSHKAMMDWMQGFGNRFDSDEILEGKALSPEKQQWLDEEESKIKAVREQINSSIQRAESLLEAGQTP